jgi:hypothetical protein
VPRCNNPRLGIRHRVPISDTSIRYDVVVGDAGIHYHASKCADLTSDNGNEGRASNDRVHPLCEAQRSKVRCSVLLAFVITLQSYYYFSFGVFFHKMPERFRNLT